MRINRAWQMPSKNTFEIGPIKALIGRYIEKLKQERKDITVVDPFANQNNIGKDYGVTEIRNDLDPQYDTDFHLDALDFLRTLPDDSVDLLLYDPPYSPRQVSECYTKLGRTVNFKTTQASYWAAQKKEIGRVLKTGGYAISCAWNSGGIGQKYGMTIEEILLVAHGGWHNDTIVVVDKKKF